MFLRARVACVRLLNPRPDDRYVLLLSANKARGGCRIAATMVRASRLLWMLPVVLGTWASSASASSYIVRTSGDPGGPCLSHTPCSLRQLVDHVNAHPFPPDKITLPPGTYNLSAALGAIMIDRSVAIVGAGARMTMIAMPVPADRDTITADDRVLEIMTPTGGATPTVTVSGVTITGGSANPHNNFEGGDVLNDGTLTLSQDWITDGFACSGAGIANSGGTLTVDQTLISGNSAACGRSAGDDSGAIANIGVPAAGSTPDLPAHLVVENSTVTGNDARLVGGIFSWNDPNNTVAISSSTIANNTTKDEPGGTARGLGGGLGSATGTIVVQDSILAGNTEVTGGVTTPTNCSTSGGAIVSLGYNLESGTDCGFLSRGDLHGADPMLGPLAANGGPTNTLALLTGSPAINAGNPAGCREIDGTPITVDQRGIARPQGPRCDIGAFELVTKPAVKITGVRVSSAKKTARFTFRPGTGAQCALVRTRGHASKPHYSSCASSKTYTVLKAGSYTFYVRVVLAGIASPPATQAITIH